MEKMLGYIFCVAALSSVLLSAFSLSAEESTSPTHYRFPPSQVTSTSHLFPTPTPYLYTPPPKPKSSRFSGSRASSSAPSNPTYKKEYKEFQKSITPRPIPRCEKGYTKTISHTPEKRDMAMGQKAYGLPNILMLREDAAKAGDSLAYDFPAFFGSKTTVHYYYSKPGDARSWNFSEAGVECLPFRMRVTTDATHVYYGPEALKNYDEPLAASGKNQAIFQGEMHPTVGQDIKKFW